MSEHTPFLTIFPGCEDLKNYCGGLDKAYVTDVQIDRGDMTMTVCAWFPAMPSPVEISTLSERLKTDYALNGAGLVPEYPRPKAAPAPAAMPAPAGAARPRGTCSWAGPSSKSPSPWSC